MRLPPPRAIIFDWDNTLVDSWRSIHHALETTFRAMGQQPWSLEETRRNVRRSARESFPELFGARSDEAMKVFFGTFEANHLCQMRPYEGAGDLLARLAATGIPLAILSNKQGDLLKREVAHLGWEGHFQRIVGAGDAARDKPAEEAVLMALAGSGVSPGPSVWLIGDTDIDMLCAARNGCTAVLLRPEPPKPEEFTECVPNLHVPGCHALAELALNS